MLKDDDEDRFIYIIIIIIGDISTRDIVLLAHVNLNGLLANVGYCVIVNSH